MFRQTDPMTSAARRFNGALDELIKISDAYHSDEPMLVIAKRKLAFARRVDMLLPVQLAWQNKLLKGHGEAIIKRDEQYFINTPHTSISEFAGTRNDVTADDVNRLLRMFHEEWSTILTPDVKDRIWTQTQELYKAYLDYGFATKQ